jgi:outer membrane immunogenic protein
MKKALIALTAAAAFTGSAYAADLPARMPMKAPPPAPVATWTGCYIGGGGGYGLWNQEKTEYTNPPGVVQLTDTTTGGGRGYFGTVQGGCDYQFGLGGNQFVIGAFGDYDFASLTGRDLSPAGLGVGNEKMSGAWAAGARIGWLAFPQLLTYFSAGYTEAKFDQVNYTFNAPPFGVPSGVYMGGRTYQGWFLGAGDEYALNFLPGLFWKTEYRFSRFDTATNPFIITSTGLRGIDSVDSKKWVQTIRSELTYHFNWGGPVVAKY